MRTFAKAQVASLIASIVDYWFTIIAVELFGLWYVSASACGTMAGGITNFSLGRNWVFRNREKAAQAQLFKYGVVWCGYLVLTTTGVFMLTHYMNLNYIISKVVVSLFMAVSYNYPLQKKYVFR
ncbi:MAG TPA: GtrA family protein [Flavisolibacter sp.]|jgi:putative flippase GtrA|nr:GtrA family protein [Flavisolibacter sp.]